MNGPEIMLHSSTKADIADWFSRRAAAVDVTEASAYDGLQFLAERGLLAQGIAPASGGDGGGLDTMIEVIATVAEQCLTSAFVLWSHRALIGLVASSDNSHLHAAFLPDLLSARRFGAVGLANVMKYAASLEGLALHARRTTKGYVLSGTVPWATNLVENRYIVAVAAGTADGAVLLAAVNGETADVQRGQLPRLLALNGSSSGSLAFECTFVDENNVIHRDGLAFLASARPAFLLLQCGLPWGLGKAALTSASRRATGTKAPLRPAVEALQNDLDNLTSIVIRLSRTTAFTPHRLYELLSARKQLTKLALEAVHIDVEATGGAGYVASSPTARRLREAAFLPLQTPTLLQLRTQLHQLKTEL